MASYAKPHTHTHRLKAAYTITTECLTMQTSGDKTSTGHANITQNFIPQIASEDIILREIILSQDEMQISLIQGAQDSQIYANKKYKSVEEKVTLVGYQMLDLQQENIPESRQNNVDPTFFNILKKQSYRQFLFSNTMKNR